MSYQVIARKYRPQRFADVVGQEHVTTTLGNAIASGRIAHAYLFAGPRGTGKTTIARIFSKCLNATNGPTVDFKDDDEICAEITEGRSLDVLEIDGASNRGIDQIRELRDTVNYAPAGARYKVYIIDEVHMLTKEAFNALLKTLEEPPGHVKFMFATTEPEQVLATILSRCQRFDLRRIPAALIVEHLTGIAKKEKVKIDVPALHAIARGADGGMRDAEGTLDQLISFCGDKIMEDDVLSMFGLASQGKLLGLAESVLKGEPESTLRQFNELASGGKELRRLVGDLLNHFRNLLVLSVSKGDASLLEITESEKEAITGQVKLADSGALGRILEVLTDCEMRLRDASSKKILVEVSLLKAIQASNAMSLNEVLDKLQELRGSASPQPARVPAPKTTSKAPVQQKPEPVASKETTDSPAGNLVELWPQLVRVAGEMQPFAVGYLTEAHPVLLDEKHFTIGFAPEFSDQMELADNPTFNQTLQKALAKLGHADVEVKFVKAERPAAWLGAPTPIEAPAGQEIAAPAETKKTKPAGGPIDMEEFKNDPLIKKALEVFKGQIVDVRSP